MRWAPIADRPLGARARLAIRELAAILAEPASDASPSLALGDAGTAVFFAYLGRARVPGIGRRAADRARFYARRATAGQAQGRPLLGLFGGLAGVGWMLHHLRGAELPRRDPCAELDAALRVAIEHGALDGELDLVTGLCGVGIYALARRNRRLAAAVVSRLLARDPWGDPARGAVDLGTAH